MEGELLKKIAALAIAKADLEIKKANVEEQLTVRDALGAAAADTIKELNAGIKVRN